MARKRKSDPSFLIGKVSGSSRPASGDDVAKVINLIVERINDNLSSIAKALKLTRLVQQEIADQGNISVNVDKMYLDVARRLEVAERLMRK